MPDIQDVSAGLEIGIKNLLLIRTEVASHLVVEQLREELSVQYPPASQPGEFPARRTGNLMYGFEVQVDPFDDVVDIIPDHFARYAFPLAESGRLSTSTVFDDMRGEIANIIVGG